MPYYLYMSEIIALIQQKMFRTGQYIRAIAWIMNFKTAENKKLYKLVKLLGDSHPTSVSISPVLEREMH